jgi:hypothetical protein
MYLHLVRASRLRRQPLVRDKLLVLAGVQAHEMGLRPIANLCRHTILAHNPRHLMRRWPTVSDALQDDEFQLYLKQLRRRYSQEKIEHMITSLRIELGCERQAYENDLEYAAALLGTRPETIDGILARDPSELAANPGTPVEPVDGTAAWAEESVVGRILLWGAVVFALLSGAVLAIGRMLTR